MKNDVDYIVKDNQVIIVDSFTGRLMPGRRFNDGLHQALEAKEKVKIQKETRTLATVTFQNYFRMYGKLSGMTGTALTEEDEFRDIYALDVVEVPTNKPMIRKDLNDAVYRTYAGKIRAIVRQIKECHEKGQPVLVGTVSIDKSEELSAILKRAGIPHNVLNAKQHEKEADIVAQAGRFGAVTISTNMAGRGTDIMLGGNPEYMAKSDLRKRGYEDKVIADAVGTGVTTDETVLEARALFHELYKKYKEQIRPEAEKVKAAGGLFILGTERHESRRIDNQLRGRSGRQGDEGASRFYLSLEDDLMRLFGASEKLLSITERLGLDEDTAIDARILSGQIERAQRKIESMNFARRKNVLTYDDVMNQQRSIIYKQRSDVLCSDDIRDTIKNMILTSVKETCEFCFGTEEKEHWKFDEFRNHYMGLLTDGDGFKYTDEALAALDKDSLCERLCEKAMEIYEGKDALFGSIEGMRPDAMREIEKVILLENVDKKWMEHLDNMEELKEYIGLNSYAQRDPVAMYRIQGADLFDTMIDDIKEDTVRKVLSVVPKVQKVERVQVAQPLVEGFGDGKAVKRAPVKSTKVGRNDPCPCGSGQKYKKCCGRSSTED